MLFDGNKIQNVYLACGYTDMRKQIDGLAAIVELQYKMEFILTSINICNIKQQHHLEDYCRQMCYPRCAEDHHTTPLSLQLIFQSCPGYHLLLNQ